MQKGCRCGHFISNFSEDVNTSTLLASASRASEGARLSGEPAQELGFDGINIDFEGIAQEAGYAYVQFIA